MTPTDPSVRDAPHPVDQILVWADMYEREGGHGLIVQMLRRYAALSNVVAVHSQHCDEHAECDDLRERMAALLTGVANALRGDPGPLRRWSWHDLPVRAAVMREQRDSAQADFKLLAEEPAPFCWLVELFQRGGNSMGRYHTGLTDLGYQSRSTTDPHQAKKYTKEQAQAEADALNVHMKACEWRAVEHGFHTAAPQEPAPMTREWCAAYPGAAAGIINRLARQVDATKVRSEV
jgi:hypothetical protein